jgi:DNA-directed RNA polymerase sigma subunit (sigma70/sigma32)
MGERGERIREAVDGGRLEALPPEARDVLTLRYGLDGGDALSPDAVAEELHMEPGAVRDLEERAADALANPVELEPADEP